MRLIAINGIQAACAACGTDGETEATATAAFERSVAYETPETKRAADHALSLWLARVKCGRHGRAGRKAVGR